MKFVTYLKENQERAGLLLKRGIIDIERASQILGSHLSSKMSEILNDWERVLLICSNFEQLVFSGSIDTIPLDSVKLISPVPHPTSCRDGYAFRQHVETARRNRGVPMIAEFDQYPVFYFTNHNAIFGEGDLFLETDHFQKLDFELECAVVIGKRGKNVRSSEADSYIAGYLIMNDFSARTLQMEEMLLNLGPAKGKDFATTLGPYLVTPDELEDFKVSTPFGNKYNLQMKAYHNGEKVSEGNLSDMNWTFAEIIERVSYGVEIFPGDVIGSGTVGTGCYLELNGSNALLAKEKGISFSPIWLQEDDEITLEIGGLGKLTNTIRKNPNSYSLLGLKKL